MRWLVGWIARGVAFALFRKVEVDGRSHVRRGVPTLLVANHFNGFVDPVVIAAALGRLPRFIAKASLARIPLLGLLLRSLGVVLVQRTQDGQGTAGNVSAFVACHEALRAGDLVAIFPEGTTHDRPSLAPLRTGAARIALGARQAGVDGIRIVPVGLAFPDKLALRSAALVRIGPPIDVDEVTPPGVGEDDQEGVRHLTKLIDERLREVAPDFEDVEEWRSLDLAAEITLRGHDDPDPSLVERARLARRLGRLPSEEREEIRVRLARYLLDLHVVGLSEREVGAGKSSRELLRDAIWAGLATVILGPLALAGLVVNLIPAAIVAAVSLWVRTPVTKGTVRTLVGIIAFPVAWIAASVPIADGWAVLATAAGYAAGAAALVVVAEQAVQLLHSALAWHAVRERAGALDVVRLRRREVVEEVTRARAPR